MIVQGFIVIMTEDPDTNYVETFYHPKLVIFSGGHGVKVAHKMKKEREKTNIDQKIQLSIFYMYEVRMLDQYQYVRDKINLLIQRFVEKLKRYQNDTITVAGELSNFTSINIDNQDKKVIRTLAHFNFSLTPDYKLYLNHFFSNCKIMRDDFMFSTPERDLIEFYDVSHRRIRAVVPYLELNKIEMFPDSYSSFYMQCSVTPKSQEITIKYSDKLSWRQHVFYAIHTYLSYLKNPDDFKQVGRVAINANFIIGGDMIYSRYNLILDVYNFHDSKSYLYNLFVVFIREAQNKYIGGVFNKSRWENIKTLQIILTHNKAKEYKLLQNKNFYDRVQMLQTIVKILHDSEDSFRLYGAQDVCIIPEERNTNMPYTMLQFLYKTYCNFKGLKNGF